MSFQSLPTTITKVTLIILSGRSGSGKSSVANHLHALFSKDHRQHAAIETDALDMVYPEVTGPELFLCNLEAVWKNVRSFYANTALEWREIAASVKSATLAAIVATNQPRPEALSKHIQITTQIVVLTASDETVRTRLGVREIGSNEEFEAHMASSMRVAKLLDNIELDTEPDQEAFRADSHEDIVLHRVPTDRRTVDTVADDVLERLNRAKTQ